MARRRAAAAVALRRVAPAPLLALGLALALGRVVDGASGPCSSLDISALFPTGGGGGGSSSPDIGAMMGCITSPEAGLSPSCQNDVIGMGGNCMADFQALGALADNPKVTAVIQQIASEAGVKLNGTSAADVAAAVKDSNATDATPPSDDEISKVIAEVLPEVEKALPSGKISSGCCSSIGDVKSDSCLCGKTTMELVYSSIPGSDMTDLNPYMKFVAQVMDKLGCTSLDGLVVYPSSDCPSS